ncbi:hypothetical protein [Streptomyces avicenniae]|uniref:hypothetical protein n=1 Tax=Streptomyces avicenniae TaxID=500153 RepID=UPI00069C8214|nr:hypothetical protein [Streptomyces avicenniae]
METEEARPTPEEALAALAEAEQVKAATAALSATPWPTWFAVTLALYLASFPFTSGAALADSDWLVPHPAWRALMAATTVVFLALFAVAARRWREDTGVALRYDVLPKRLLLPLLVVLPAVLVGAPVAFRATGWPGWLVAASLIAAATSLAFHRVFVRLHRPHRQAA